jgi:hypothetical protein
VSAHVPSFRFNGDALLALNGVELSEHNRSPLSVDFERLSRDTRTVEGFMRRQHIATKRTFSVSWTDLPDRRAHTVDRRAGGADLVELLESGVNRAARLVVNGDGVDVLIESYDYEVTARRSYQFWDVSLTLVEI